MRDKATVLVPFILIMVAEVFFFFHDVSTTLSIHLVNIFICVMMAIFIERYSDLFQALMLVSLLRVLNIGMPIFFTMTLYWMPFIYGSIILSAYIVWRIATEAMTEEQRSMGIAQMPSYWGHRIWEFMNGGGSLGKAHWENLYAPAAVIIGLVLANMEYQVLGPDPLVPDLGFGNLALLAVVMIVFVGFGEELIFRGFLQNRIEKHWGMYPAIIGSSLVFSMMHSGYASVAYLFFVFFVGLVLAVLYRSTRSLVFVALVHGFLNFFLFSILPNGWAIRL
jgi:uncharacterized protein